MKKTPLKMHIAHLFSQMNKFSAELDSNGQWTKRFLVNQNAVDAPDRDALLRMIGESAGELIEFIRNHDEVIDRLAASTSQFMLINQALTTLIGEEAIPLMEKIELVAGRYAQMISVLHRIAHDLPTDKCKEAAQKFLEFKGKKLKLIPFPSEKDEESPTIPCTCSNGHNPLCEAREHNFTPDTTHGPLEPAKNVPAIGNDDGEPTP